MTVTKTRVVGAWAGNLDNDNAGKSRKRIPLEPCMPNARTDNSDFRCFFGRVVPLNHEQDAASGSSGSACADDAPKAGMRANGLRGAGQGGI
ncbi:hypothetical protein [Bifidobacterium scardovii]|uniref:hypothetical protein n=1 Tax=Bifidobacterium scardovii TaxID=158787 RepID=UPI0011874F1A|nr:hypothetical protein [Bifidobacterium scardovii]MDK6350114.1 hypothetical protein [Bifidobacterium scardovii]MDU2421067.1 hypothetical protein [Bifidobacterium scardovii]MDU8981430.1 hypothetical protein [Bifidobacterium scardovii]